MGLPIGKTRRLETSSLFLETVLVSLARLAATDSCVP